MKPKSILLWVATFAFTFGIISCGKDEVIEIPPVPDGQDTVYYVIDTTKKITIGEILYLENKFMTVSGNWQDVAYGNGRWIAVGNGGQIAISTDGINWSTQQAGGVIWNRVTYGNGQWIAVGISGLIANSIDSGQTWTTRIVGGGTQEWLDLEYSTVSGVFIAVGGTRLAISADGVEWFYSNSLISSANAIAVKQ
jgi:hypothetical protein